MSALTLAATDPRLVAAQSLERLANELYARSDDLLNDSARLRREARLLREAVEDEAELAAVVREADAELATLSRRTRGEPPRPGASSRHDHVRGLLGVAPDLELPRARL